MVHRVRRMHRALRKEITSGGTTQCQAPAGACPAPDLKSPLYHRDPTDFRPGASPDSVDRLPCKFCKLQLKIGEERKFYRLQLKIGEEEESGLIWWAYLFNCLGYLFYNLGYLYHEGF